MFDNTYKEIKGTSFTNEVSKEKLDSLVKQKLSLYLPLPKIKDLYLEAGGMRGVVYPKVLHYLDANGDLGDVENLIGVSAGSIASFFIALGVPPEELKEILDKFDFSALINIKDFSLFGRGLFSIQRLENALTPIANEQFQKRINEARALIEQSDKTDKEQYLSKLNTLSGNTITFQQLNELKQIFEQFGTKHKIKNLFLLGVDTKTQNEFVFSIDSTPNLSIPKVVAASSAIPYIFRSVELEMNGKKQLFQDGGIKELIALSVKPNRFCTSQERRLNMLGLLIQPDARSMQYIYHLKDTSLKGFFLYKLILNGLLKLGHIDSKTIHEYGLSMVPLNVDLNPINFSLPANQLREAEQIALQSIEHYFSLYRNGSAYEITDDLMACLLRVPLSQIELAKQELLQCFAEETDVCKQELSDIIDFLVSYRKSQEQLEKHNIGDQLDRFILEYCTLPANKFNLVLDNTHTQILFERLVNGIPEPVLKNFCSHIESQDGKTHPILLDFYSYCWANGVYTPAPLALSEENFLWSPGL